VCGTGLGLGFSRLVGIAFNLPHAQRLVAQWVRASDGDDSVLVSAPTNVNSNSHGLNPLPIGEFSGSPFRYHDQVQRG